MFARKNLFIFHSTDHAVIELTNEIYQCFDKNLSTLGVFIDLSKAFDTVNHEILIKKLQNYGVKNNNLKWINSYLSNRKQCVSYGTKFTKFLDINCGVSQGSILGPLLFLIYVNDIVSSSNCLNFILFADDTNIFYSHKNINIIFETVNRELIKINEWFQANKLSLNTTKTKYTIFAKSSIINQLPLKLPLLKINNTDVKRAYSSKFLGVILDEHLTWKDHIKLVENKVSKTLGITRCFFLRNTSLRNMRLKMLKS